MNRTIKKATVKRIFYDTHQQLKAHLSDFIAAYNYANHHADSGGNFDCADDDEWHGNLSQVVAINLTVQ